MLIVVTIAFVLDFCIGDPVFKLHPTRLIGGMLVCYERVFYKIRQKVLGGALLVIAAIFSTGLLAAASVYLGRLLTIQWSLGNAILGIAIPGVAIPWIAGDLWAPGLNRVPGIAIYPVIILLVFFLFCNRDMTKEARSVYERLQRGDLPGARKRLGRIVGRDTELLDQRAIIRATVETVSENIVDGFTSPFFYLLLGGVMGGVLLAGAQGSSLGGARAGVWGGIPLAYAFKTVSTIDSMFGYRNERYEKFGKVGARFDDVLNYVPARLNVIFMLCASGFSRALWRAVVKFGRDHPSPNSGLAEAAFAGYLGLALGGPSIYGGVEKVKPWLGENMLQDRARDAPALILRAVRLYVRVVIVNFALGLAAGYAATAFLHIPLL